MLVLGKQNRVAAVFLCVAACVLMLCGACSPRALPTPSQRDAAHEFADVVHQKAIEARTSIIQDQLSETVQLASELRSFEERLETLTSTLDNPNFYTEWSEIRKQQKETIEKAVGQVEQTRKVLDEGMAWARNLAEKSQEVQQSSEHFLQQLEQASAGLADMSSLMNYEQQLFALRDSLGDPPENPELGMEESYYSDTWEAYGSYGALEAPQCMKDLHARYVRSWKIAGTFFYDASITNSSSELDRRSLVQMVDWISACERVTLGQQAWVAAQQYDFAAKLMTDQVDPSSAPQVNFRAIERVSPNLYQSLDSVLDLTICAAQAQDVVIEVEIAGLSLTHTTKLVLQPGVNYFELKPELLPGLSAKDLETAFTTQLNYKMTSPDGTVVDAQSSSVEVLTAFDYLWYNDKFGYAAQYELFAWLRPGTAIIDELNRRAADYVSEWTDGQFREINGYQYGADWYGTLLQAAAIQKAFSDYDIAYIIDTYTPRADQRVLTPAAVFEKRQALCIESSLVMASALLSAGMHPMLIITPGHAQVAVETWADSGQYILLETAQLPYAGLDRSMDSANAWAWNGFVPVYDDGAGAFSTLDSYGGSGEWVRYFNWIEDYNSDTYGGIFVLDCYAQRIMDITGLESL